MNPDLSRGHFFIGQISRHSRLLSTHLWKYWQLVVTLCVQLRFLQSKFIDYYELAPLLATQKPTWILGRLEEIFLTQRLGSICCNLQNHDHRHELLSEFHWLGLFKTGWTRSSPSCSRSQSLGISVWGFCWAGGDHRRTQWPGLSCKINQLNQNLILDMFATRVSPVVGDISEDFVPVRPARDRPSFQTSDQIPLWLHRFYF